MLLSKTTSILDFVVFCLVYPDSNVRLITKHGWGTPRNIVSSKLVNECWLIRKPLAYDFEFIEIYAGAVKITFFLSKMNVRCGPPMKQVRLIEWLTHLIVNRGLAAFAVEPPCTTYSIMRRPALRDKQHPYGLDPTDPQTWDGNVLGQRAFRMMHVGGETGCVGLLETPNSSKLKNMPSWKHLAARRYARALRTDSCRFGSPHLKSFKVSHGEPAFEEGDQKMHVHQAPPEGWRLPQKDSLDHHEKKHHLGDVVFFFQAS